MARCLTLWSCLTDSMPGSDFMTLLSFTPSITSRLD